MSIKPAVARASDETTIRLLAFSKPKSVSTIKISPAFHVEKLYDNENFENLLNFCREFHKMTKVRAVLTCMTPHSPILAREIEGSNLSVEDYWSRIETLKEFGVIGLHGHFVRGFIKHTPIPMHCYYNDLDAIKKQIDEELEALRSRNLIDNKIRVYSGGWWFTSQALRTHLVERGFSWDYSISSSDYNRSQGSGSLSLTEVDGCLVQHFGKYSLRSPVAISGISKKSRPYHALAKILRYQRARKTGALHASLYSHDYDLELRSSIKFVERALDMGIHFFEPTSTHEKA